MYFLFIYIYIFICIFLWRKTHYPRNPCLWCPAAPEIHQLTWKKVIYSLLNIDPAKMLVGSWETTFLLGGPSFRAYVGSKEGYLKTIATISDWNDHVGLHSLRRKYPLRLHLVIIHMVKSGVVIVQTSKKTNDALRRPVLLLFLWVKHWVELEFLSFKMKYGIMDELEIHFNWWTPSKKSHFRSFQIISGLLVKYYNTISSRNIPTGPWYTTNAPFNANSRIFRNPKFCLNPKFSKICSLQWLFGWPKHKSLGIDIYSWCLEILTEFQLERTFTNLSYFHIFMSRFFVFQSKNRLQWILLPSPGLRPTENLSSL